MDAIAASMLADELPPRPPTERAMRGAAAHLWWSYYRVLKNRDGVIAK